MLYWFLKPLMNFGLRAFFSKIYLSGVENIPRNKPVILACNHPNSFLDAIIMGALLRRPVHFLTRGDVFNTPFKKWLLWQMKMFPIFRLEEGVENLHKNQETFEVCKKILEKNGVIMIFSEGLCIIEKRLRKLRKGTARIAFSTEESSNWALDIQVVPVGLNYTHPTLARKELMISIAKPFPVSQLKNQYEQNQALAIKQFNELLSERLRNEVVHVADKANDKIAEQILELQRNNEKQSIFPRLSHKNDRKMAEWNTIEKLNSMDETSLNKLRSDLDGYFASLKKNKISDKSLNQPLKSSVLTFLGLMIGFPITFVGYLLSVWPWRLSVKLTKKVVRSNVFQASVNLGSAFFLYLIWYAILFSISPLFPGPIKWLLWTSPITAYFAIIWTEAFSNWLANNRVKELKNKLKNEYESLKMQRVEILAQL